jgi:hypothetical protein
MKIKLVENKRKLWLKVKHCKLLGFFGEHEASTTFVEEYSKFSLIQICILSWKTFLCVKILVIVCMLWRFVAKLRKMSRNLWWMLSGIHYIFWKRQSNTGTRYVSINSLYLLIFVIFQTVECVAVDSELFHPLFLWLDLHRRDTCHHTTKKG